MRETRVQSLGWGDPISQPTLVFLPGESHGQRSLVGYSPWGHEESDTTAHTQGQSALVLFTFYGKCAIIILTVGDTERGALGNPL